MPSNTAALIPSAKVKPLEIKPATYTPPASNEIVIKNHALAINPVDWAIQDMGNDLFNFLTYPFVGGSDIAGEVVEVGSAVTRFKPGDRVLAMATAMSGKDTTGGAFQTYTHVLGILASPIPDSLSYESAAVIPLGISTAACGLYQKDFLALQHPSVSPKSAGETLVIWGGSTSVGSNAIQLAVASGYEVFATASPKNFDYVKSLGASQAFDYNSRTVVADILSALKGKTSAGVLGIGSTSAPASNDHVAASCLEIVSKSEGKKFMAAVVRLPETIPEGVGAKFVFGSTLKDNEVGPAVYVDFLPEALKQGKYQAKPDPEVVGTGLESLQQAYEVQKKGVSAKKVVVTL